MSLRHSEEIWNEKQLCVSVCVCVRACLHRLQYVFGLRPCAAAS